MMSLTPEPTGNRVAIVRAVADGKVYDRAGICYRHTPTDPVDVTTECWMLSGLSQPLICLRTDGFFVLTEAGSWWLATADVAARVAKED